MGKLLRNGTYLKCSEGLMLGQLQVSKRATHVSGEPAAEALDLGVQFGACKSLKNPLVAQARGAPQMCIPVMQPPLWNGAAGHVLIKGRPAIHENCTLTCV